MTLTPQALPRDPSSVPEVPQLEMSKTVEVLRMEAEGADMMLTGLVLMRYLAQRPANQKAMAQCNCIALVLRSLHLHDSNATLQGVACDTLGNLLQEQSNTDQFLKMSGVEAVLQVIKSNMAHTRVLEAACFLLGNVASSEHGLQEISKHGGAAAALTVIKTHDQDAELLREILFLVSNMAQSTNLQAELLKAGAVDQVVTVMDLHGTSAEMTAMGCSALDNLLATSTDDADVKKAPQGPIPKAALSACLRALNAHASNASVVRRAAGAIGSMAAAQPRSPLFVVNGDVINALTAGGRSMITGKHDALALVQVLRALEVVSDYPENRSLVLQPGGPVSLAVSMAQSANARPAPVARGLSLVAKLCESELQRSQGGMRVPEEDGLSIVVSSLSNFWNHPSVVIPACTIIAAMAKDATSGRPAPDESWSKAIAGLLKALRARPGDVAVAVSACVALAWACERKVVPAGAEVGDIMGAFVMVMRAHPRDADVAEAACFMFSAVAKNDSPTIRQQVIKSGAPLLVVMVLRHFSEAPGDVHPVLRRAVNAIRLVGLDDSATAGVGVWRLGRGGGCRCGRVAGPACASCVRVYWCVRSRAPHLRPPGP